MHNLKPQLPMLAPRLGYADLGERSQVRQRTEHWQAWYTSRRWRKLRWEVLVRDLFRCAMCQHTIADSSQLVCDHIRPHRGEAKAFWSGPFQTLCKPCHDSVKQAEERASLR